MGFSGFSRRASSDGELLRVFGLAGFPVGRKARVGRKRNPENPANPENHDSDKDARLRGGLGFRPLDSRFRGNDGVEGAEMTGQESRENDGAGIARE